MLFLIVVLLFDKRLIVIDTKSILFKFKKMQKKKIYAKLKRNSEHLNTFLVDVNTEVCCLLHVSRMNTF